MSGKIKKEIQLEIAHVLFIDIVGYSKLSINDQRAAIDELTQAVRASEQFQKAEAAARLIKIPTGDGMALVFYKSPEEPVECALEISRALKEHPKLQLRMGVHSGPVSGVIDVNGQANLAGVGLNMAQRVMDCGDAGHILLSKRVADDLGEYEHWRPLLHDLGECEVKHGTRVSIVNLHGDEVGNPQLPKKLQALKKHRARMRRVIAAAALVTLVVALVVVKKFARTTSTILEKGIAVLPFENLSEDKANAYFADGIQDEILTKLASIADLKVISRTSTAKYRSKPEDLKTVSQQLGVANVLEGSVQKAADKVRVNVQLIDARADSHLWAKSYDRGLKDVFAVESEVSQEIADALRTKLSPKEANNLATAPTKDSEAYDLFLQAEYEHHEAETSFKPESFERAAALYKQAMARDPNFALAIARLVEIEVKRNHVGDAFSQAEIEEVGKTAEHAVALAPDLAEAHVALGLFYYFGKFQYNPALAAFQHALALQPNNLAALRYCAGIHARQGQLERSLAEFKKCEALDPRDPNIADAIAGSYLVFRMWPEAKRGGLHALALDPHNVAGMHIVFFSELCGAGDLKEAARILQSFPPAKEIGAYTAGGYLGLVGLNSYFATLNRDFAGALKFWDYATNDPAAERTRLCARIAIQVLAGDSPDASEIEKARNLAETKLTQQPEDVDTMIQLSWINLALHRNDEALRLARHGADLVPVKIDAMAGPFVLAALAEIEARTGHATDAIEHLRGLLAISAGMQCCIQRLKIDPAWDPIRNDPGFKQLLAGKEQIGPNK
jgi:TolB-like protein/class 3 adenylate cyclase/cytochrome c-type biogenesis protein CcmH/NrfG